MNDRAPGAGWRTPAALAHAPAALASAAATIAILTVVARVAGFGRWVVQSGTVGRGCVGQIYTAANQIPNVIYEVAVGGALVAAVVPALAPMVSRRGGSPAADGAGDRIAGSAGQAGSASTRGAGPQADPVVATVSALLSWVLLMTVPLALLLVAAAPALADPLTPQGCAGGESLARYFVAVFAAQVVLYGVGVVAIGVSQAHRRFALPAAAPLLSSVVVILAYVMTGWAAGDTVDDPAAFPPAARAWLGWGTTAGVAGLSLPVLAFMVWRLRIRPTFTLRFPPGIAYQVRGQATGGLAALLAQQLSVIVILVLSSRSGAPVGTLPLWQYTQAVFLLPIAILALPVITATFPVLSAARGTDFTTACARTHRGVLAAGLVGMAGTVAVAAPAQVFFGNLDASGRGADGMATALLVLAPAVLATGAMTHAARALQAFGRPRPAALAIAAGWSSVAVAAPVVLLGGGAVVDDIASHTLIVISGATTVGLVIGWVCAVISLRGRVGAGSTQGALRLLILGGSAALTAGLAGAAVGRAALGASVFGTLTAQHGRSTQQGWEQAAMAAAGGAASAVLLCAVLLSIVSPGWLRAVRARMDAGGHGR